MKIRPKPHTKEAIQFTGAQSFDEMEKTWGRNFSAAAFNFSPTQFQIGTLEGTYFVNRGDWVVKGLRGEFYPIKPDIFEETYEVLES